MYCYFCGSSLHQGTDVCPACGNDVYVWKKAAVISNYLYNSGLAKAQKRDMGGAIKDLELCLKYNKGNIDARNLLGLVYYEIGETVKALAEWIVSTTMLPDDNPATEYIDNVHSDAGELDEINQTIKKYNQALAYSLQGDLDLAEIQLKNVVDKNPKYLKANQLLALLYLKQCKYQDAKGLLINAKRVDLFNEDTLDYIQECRAGLRAFGDKPKEDDDVKTFVSGNETIIEPAKTKNRIALTTVINLIIGIAIGIAICSFLIIPGMKNKMNSNVQSQLVEANEASTSKEQAIADLQTEVDNLKADVEEANADKAAAEAKAAGFESLIGAYSKYSAGDTDGTIEALDAIDVEALDESSKAAYDYLKKQMGSEISESALQEGIDLYWNDEFKGAAAKFEVVYAADPTYNDCEAAYYLGYCYRKLDQDQKALDCFNVVINSSSNSNYVADAEDQAEALKISLGQ